MYRNQASMWKEARAEAVEFTPERVLTSYIYYGIMADSLELAAQQYCLPRRASGRRPLPAIRRIAIA